ncbi:MAG: MCE family protein [Aeromicrobium sp.]
MTGESLLQRFAGLSKFLTAFVILALIVAGAVMLMGRDGTRYVTVDFKQANSLYKGSDVKILGVPVGTVESMTPKGDVVRVKIAYEGKYKLPNEVKAAIVSPSIVGDRFVQLSPAYSGGAVLPDNAVLDVRRSVVPLELDEIYSSLDDLSVALGPDGANKDGSLSNLIDNSAKSLDGQGEQLNETITNFSKLSQTLSNNKDELFGSLTEVQTFVAMLKENDASVRAFNDSTAKVSTVLEGEREDLAATLKALGLALNDVRSLVKDNRSALCADVDDLTSISEVLVDNEDSIEEAVIAAPTALSNVAFTYNSKYGTLDTRANLLEALTGGATDPGDIVCGLLGGPDAPPGLCDALGGILDSLPPLSALSGGKLPDGTLPTDKLPTDKLPTDPAEKLPIPLPRTAAASGATMQSERVHNSIHDMLAVK